MPQFSRDNPLEYKKNHVILQSAEGRGQYVGTYLAWGVNSNRWWGEGEIKFFMDGDKEFPTSAEQVRRIISAVPGILSIPKENTAGFQVLIPACIRSSVRMACTVPSSASVCTVFI